MANANWNDGESYLPGFLSMVEPDPAEERRKTSVCLILRSSTSLNLSLLELQNSENGFTDACINCCNGYIKFHFRILLAALSRSWRLELENKVHDFLLNPTTSSDPRIISAQEVFIEDMCSVLFLLYTGATMLKEMMGSNNNRVFAEGNDLKTTLKNILDKLKVNLGVISEVTPVFFGPQQDQDAASGDACESSLRVLKSLVPGIEGLHLRWGHKRSGRVEEFEIDINGISRQIRSVPEDEQPSFCTRCWRLFSDSTTAERHTIEEHKEGPAHVECFDPAKWKYFECEIESCFLKIVSVKGYLKHVEENHGVEYGSYYKLRSKPECLMCTKKDVQFSHLPSFMKHVYDCSRSRGRKKLKLPLEPISKIPGSNEWYNQIDMEPFEPTPTRRRTRSSSASKRKR